MRPYQPRKALVNRPIRSFAAADKARPERRCCNSHGLCRSGTSRAAAPDLGIPKRTRTIGTQPERSAPLFAQFFKILGLGQPARLIDRGRKSGSGPREGLSTVPAAKSLGPARPAHDKSRHADWGPQPRAQEREPAMAVVTSDAVQMPPPRAASPGLPPVDPMVSSTPPITRTSELSAQNSTVSTRAKTRRPRKQRSVEAKP